MPPEQHTDTSKQTHGGSKHSQRGAGGEESHSTFGHTGPLIHSSFCLCAFGLESSAWWNPTASGVTSWSSRARCFRAKRLESTFQPVITNGNSFHKETYDWEGCTFLLMTRNVLFLTLTWMDEFSLWCFDQIETIHSGLCGLFVFKHHFCSF